MRILATGAALLLALSSCSTTQATGDSSFLQPNSIMAEEITRRVEQIPYQHRDELLENLMWLGQSGEQSIPALLQGLKHESPKVRSSCAWVLGRLRDRRTIPQLQAAMRDSEAGVRMEVARTLVVMGDLNWSPNLIEGLDSDRKEVRYLCHEALKTSTGHDFGYDHLNQNDNELRLSVLRWRQWWSDYSGDAVFAQKYQRDHNLAPQVAAPMGETKAMTPAPGAETKVSEPKSQPPAPMLDAGNPMPVGNKAETNKAETNKAETNKAETNKTEMPSKVETPPGKPIEAAPMPVQPATPAPAPASPDAKPSQKPSAKPAPARAGDSAPATPVRPNGSGN